LNEKAEKSRLQWCKFKINKLRRQGCAPLPFPSHFCARQLLKFHQRTLEGKHKRFTRGSQKPFCHTLQYGNVLCCVRVARQRKGELWTWKYAVEPSPGKLLFYLGAGAACDVPLFVFVQFIHQQRQQRDHIILRWKFILLLRSLSLASSIARELKRWRFIIPCRAATAKNSRENEFTECVSVCEKYTANRCARYHERKE
jgi:hypothetical protein